MTGKELIFQTLRHEPTPRAPWVPFAGVHAGALPLAFGQLGVLLHA